MNTIKKNLFLYLSFIFLSYSFYNIIFYPVYNTDGGMIVLLWPLFILALVWIIFSNGFIIYYILQTLQEFKKNRHILFLVILQSFAAIYGLYLQISPFYEKDTHYVTYFSHFNSYILLDLVYIFIFMIALVQRILVKDKLSFSVGRLPLAICCIILSNVLLFTNQSLSASSNTSPFIEEFKEAGLKGEVQVISIKQIKDNEIGRGVETTLVYSETMRDGKKLREVVKIPVYDKGKINSIFNDTQEEKIKKGLSDEEFEFFNKINTTPFRFLFRLYKEEDSYQSMLTQMTDKVITALEGDIIDVFDQVHTSLNRNEIYSKYHKRKEATEEDDNVIRVKESLFTENEDGELQIELIKQAVQNQKRGNDDAVGFYSIDNRQLISHHGLVFRFFYNHSRRYDFRTGKYADVDYVKNKILSLPEGYFVDGIYMMFGEVTTVNGIKNVKFTFSVKEGIVHIESQEVK